MEVIGIVGSGPSVGVTHFSILTANYLTGVLGRRTALLEWNSSGDFERLSQIRWKKAVTEKTDKAFNISGVSFYKKAERKELLAAADEGFEVAVIDFGSYRGSLSERFLQCGRRFLVGSFSEWQLPAFAELAVKPGEKKGAECFFSFGCPEAAGMMQHYLGLQVRRIPYQSDAFVITGDMMAFFGKFLR